MKSEILTWYSNEGLCYQARWSRPDGFGRKTIVGEGPMRASIDEAQRDVPIENTNTIEVTPIRVQRLHAGYEP